MWQQRIVRYETVRINRRNQFRSGGVGPNTASEPVGAEKPIARPAVWEQNLIANSWRKEVCDNNYREANMLTAHAQVVVQTLQSFPDEESYTIPRYSLSNTEWLRWTVDPSTHFHSE